MGSTSSSAGNTPLMNLRRIDNQQFSFLSPMEVVSADELLARIDAMANGTYAASVVTNGMSSIHRFADVETTSMIGTWPSTIVPVAASIAITPSSLPPGFEGRFYPLVAAAPGFTGSFAVAGDGTVRVFNAAPAGIYTVVVSAANQCGSVSSSFELNVGNVPRPPANVVATSTSATSVDITWTAVAGVTYEVQRQGAGGTLSTLGSTASGVFQDNAATADRAYLYRVRAISPATSTYTSDLATTVVFTDATLAEGITLVKAVHFTQLRTAVNAARALAGLTAATFTDPVITPGVTMVKAAHVTDLRSALDGARAALSLAPWTYSLQVFTYGSTQIHAIEVAELRAGVR
jgi:hypothetical protein